MNRTPHPPRFIFSSRGQTLAHPSSTAPTAHNPPSSHNAFTLLEMLISLALISLLGVLTLVITQQLRARATETRCAANLRQIGAANLAYAADHNGRIAARNNTRDENGNPTPRTEWYRYIWRTHFQATNGDGTAQGDTEYCSILICPADLTNGGGGEGVGESLRRSYNVNQALATKQGSRRLTDVESLHATMYAGDIDWVAAGKSEFIIGSNTSNLDAIPRDRHKGRANFVFLDGHVESIPIPEIYPGHPRHRIFQLTSP